MCCLLSKSENSVHFGSFHAGMIPLVIPRFFNAFQESPRLLVEPTLLPLFQMLQSPVLNQGRWSPGEKEKRARGGVRGVVCTLSSQGFLSYLKKDTGALGGVGVEREGKGFLSLGACASIIAIILWTPRTLSWPPHLPQGPEFSFALPSTLNWTPHQNTRAVGWGVWCLPLWGPHFSWHLLLAKSTYSIIFFCIFLTLPDFWHSILPQIFIYSPSLQHETSKPVFLIH